jgi:hypothetical protein
MTVTPGWLFRVLAFVCFVILVILIAAKASAGTLEAVLLPLGLALWVLAEIIGPARVA